MSWWLYAKKGDSIAEILTRGEPSPNFSQKELKECAARNPGCEIYNFTVPLLLVPRDIGLRKGKLYLKSSGKDLMRVRYL